MAEWAAHFNAADSPFPVGNLWPNPVHVCKNVTGKLRQELLATAGKKLHQITSSIISGSSNNQTIWMKQEATITQCTITFPNSSIVHPMSVPLTILGDIFPLHWFLFGRTSVVTSRLGQNLWAAGWMMALLGLGNVTCRNGL